VKKKRVKKHRLIVEADSSPGALTIFKMVRMAGTDERMQVNGTILRL
jgi:hypothetical protein